MNYNKIEFIASYGTSAQLPPERRPEVVFSGRSNVGKSSCINRVFSRKGLARVSAQPGKTATINFFDCGTLRFCDLPGYGYAKVGKQEKLRWAELIEGYFRQDRDIGLVFSLVDARHAPSEDDVAMIDFLIDNELPFVVLLTKVDKLKKSEREARLASFRHELPCGEEMTMIPFSAETGEGVEDVRRILDDLEAESAETPEE